MNGKKIISWYACGALILLFLFFIPAPAREDGSGNMTAIEGNSDSESTGTAASQKTRPLLYAHRFTSQRNNIGLRLVLTGEYMVEPEEDGAPRKRFINVHIDNFVDDEKVWMKIFDYANKLPLTYGGYTSVFFFRDIHVPANAMNEEGLNSDVAAYCVAAYRKYSNGTDIFRKYPFAD